MYNFLPEYYNYANNNYNQPLYTKDINPKQIYDPYQGFIRGNIFPDLYNGYKVNPIDLKPINEQAKLLTELDSICFALTDMNLYLDVYPDDKDMLNLANEYKVKLNNLVNEYEKKYAPLFLKNNVNSTYPFNWIDNPWPWMGGK